MTGREPCDGKTPCFASCNAAGQGWNEGETEALDNQVTFSEIIGIQGLDESVGGNIDYRQTSYCKTNAAKSSQIYPENKCQHRVEFHDNSSMTMVDTGEVFDYRQFCLMLNQKAVAEKKGRFMVQLCLKTNKSSGNRDEKFSFYFIIMILSVVCLAATILIYMIFKSALLRSTMVK